MENPRDKAIIRRQRHYDKKRNFLNSVKSAPCMDCGISYPPYVMDLDHVRGDKLCNPTLLVHKSMKTIIEEIQKCDVVCANCHRVRTQSTLTRNYRYEHQDRNRIIIDEAKASGCADCKIIYPPFVMDFDHVRGEKKFSIGFGIHYSVENLVSEIEKCEVVCANCHRERTENRQERRGKRL